MTGFVESESFLLPSQLKRDVANRLKNTKGIKKLELQFSGDALQGAKEFGQILMVLKRRGVKISHEVTIKLEFNRAISREKALALVGEMPRPKNGSVKVRVQVNSSKESSKE